MFISKKELETIRQFIKTQKEKNKEYDESLGKKYIHEQFENDKKQKYSASVIDEWLNGEDKKNE